MIFHATMCAACWLLVEAFAWGAPTIVQVEDFGLKADGVSNDLDAIRRALDSSRSDTSGVVILFPKNKTILVESDAPGYLFDLARRSEWTIEGNGCEFRLSPELRFLRAFDCSDLVVRRCKIDYTIQPMTPGTIVAVDAKAKTIAVRLDDASYIAKLTGPTKREDEQAFFGMMLLDAKYDTTRLKHYWIDTITPKRGNVISVAGDDNNFKNIKRWVKPGVTRIGLPVSGVAHRVGAGPVFRVNACHNARFEKINLWSAPWFATHIARNEGELVFRRFHIEPRPGSNKVLATGRDGFHCKGNRAKLRFEHCRLSGLGDDAFNIATHCSRVRKIRSDTEIEISQRYPLAYIPMRPGDTLVALSKEFNLVQGKARITKVTELPGNNLGSYENQYDGRAPRLRIQLAKPIRDLDVGHVVWARESTNPHNLLANCMIRRSCRFQSNTMLNRCDIGALCWFYGDDDEGPGPEHVTIQNSVLKLASLQDNLETIINMTPWNQSRLDHGRALTLDNTLLKEVTLRGNTIWGKVVVVQAMSVDLVDNQYYFDGPEPVTTSMCPKVTSVNNEHHPLADGDAP